MKPQRKYYKETETEEGKKKKKRVGSVSTYKKMLKTQRELMGIVDDDDGHSTLEYNKKTSSKGKRYLGSSNKKYLGSSNKKRRK